MSTNIDDIPDPNSHNNVPTTQHSVSALQTYPEKTLDTTYIQKQDINSNIKSEFSVYKEDDKIDKKDTKNNSGLLSGIFTEGHLLLLCMLIIAGQPQINDMFMKVLPLNMHNSIIVNIIKAIIIFVLYIIIMKFIL